MRFRGDPLADAVAADLHSNHGGLTNIHDLLSTVRAKAAPRGSSSCCCPLRAFLDRSSEVPPWADAALIARSVAHFREVLAIRQSSPLFRLTDAADVQARVTFYNTGVMQVPGVVVMGVSDDAADGVARACEKFNRLLVCVNVTPHEATVADARLATDLAGATMLAHPLQGQIYPDDYLLGATCVGGTVVVPGHTACVFVEPR